MIQMVRPRGEELGYLCTISHLVLWKAAPGMVNCLVPCIPAGPAAREVLQAESNKCLL